MKIETENQPLDALVYDIVKAHHINGGANKGQIIVGVENAIGKVPSKNIEYTINWWIKESGVKIDSNRMYHHIDFDTEVPLP